MSKEHELLLSELLGDFKKGQLVRLNPQGIFDFPYQKNQMAVVIGVKSKKEHYRARTGVWVWLQKDQAKALVDPWDLIEADDA